MKRFKFFERLKFLSMDTDVDVNNDTDDDNKDASV